MQEARSDELVSLSSRDPTSNYNISYKGFNFKKKTLNFNVGDYETKVQIDDLKSISRLKGSDLEKVRLALESDIKVSCTCPDWTYGGFKYIGTQLGYSITPENRAPNQNNPSLKGTVCKHLTYLLPRLYMYIPMVAADMAVARLDNYRGVTRPFDAMVQDRLSGQEVPDIIRNWRDYV